MLNPQKRNLVLGTVAVLALIGVIGVVAKKKMGTPDTGSSTETPSDSGHALGTPEAPGTPQLSHPAHPGFEPGSEGVESDSDVARKGGTDRDTVAGHKVDDSKFDSAPTLSLAMLSKGERARIEKEYPEFKNPAPRIRTAPGQDAADSQDEPVETGKIGGTKNQNLSKAFPAQKSAKGGAEAEAEVSLPKLTLAMLSPAERERIQKKYPELFKSEQTAHGTQDRTQTTVNGTQGTAQNTAFVGPIPTKPGQPLVLLQPGMPGHPDTPITKTVADAPKPEPSVDSCYTVTYHHKHPGMRAADETCAHHKNLIRLRPAEGLKLNPKTVCIRVNGTPVKFTALKNKPTDFVIGVVVGMDTAVTARYCTGKFRCNEECKVPKDEFIESIAGADMDTDETKKLEVAVWDKEDPADREANAKLAGDMQKGLKDLDEVAKAAAEGYTMFENWIPDQQTLACQNHTAQGQAADDEPAEKTRRKVASKH